MKQIQAVVPKAAVSFPIALVISQFNTAITSKMKQSAIDQLQVRGFKSEDILLVEVPGVVEIPLIAKQVAISGRFQAIVSLGAVIRGETSHYDYVCEQVSQGCQKVMLDYNIPVIFGILTTENEAQAQDRLGGHHGNKAADAIDVAIIMQSTMQALRF